MELTLDEVIEQVKSRLIELRTVCITQQISVIKISEIQLTDELVIYFNWLGIRRHDGFIDCCFVYNGYNIGLVYSNNKWTQS